MSVIGSVDLLILQKVHHKGSCCAWHIMNITVIYMGRRIESGRLAYLCHFLIEPGRQEIVLTSCLYYC